MTQRPHHIRILAGFEIAPHPQHRSILEREATERLASALADDLARILPDDTQALLVVSGLVIEPQQLLQPHFPIYQALEQMAKTVTRDHGPEGVLAIGAHQGRMPDERLQMSDENLSGAFVVIPAVLITNEASGPHLEALLEERLFESGSINPPARALLANEARLDSVHGQLLTLNDLLALQRVQFDGVGMSGFWEIIESVLLAPNDDHVSNAPAGVAAHWLAEPQILMIPFLTFNQWALELDSPSTTPERGYGLYLRAFRQLVALCEGFGVSWAVETTQPAVWDEATSCVVESGGSADHFDLDTPHLTTHHDDELGLMAWTWIDDGRMVHLYPMSLEAIERTRADFSKRKPRTSEVYPGLCYNTSTLKLTPHNPC